MLVLSRGVNDALSLPIRLLEYLKCKTNRVIDTNSLPAINTKWVILYRVYQIELKEEIYGTKIHMKIIEWISKQNIFRTPVC